MKESQVWGRFKHLMPYLMIGVCLLIAHRLIQSTEWMRWWMGVLAPFFYWFVVAYIINIPCKSVQNLLDKSTSRFVRKWQKGLSILIVFIILIGLVIGAINFIVPPIVESVNFFIENIPVYVETIVGLVVQFNDLNPLGLPDISMDEDGFFGMITQFFEAEEGFFSIEMLTQPLMSIAEAGFSALIGVGNALVGVGASMFTGFITIVASIYILVEKERAKAFFTRAIEAFFSNSIAQTTLWSFKSLNRYVKLYIKTQTIDGIILGSMATIALWLMGSPYALLLGMMLGIVNYIPYFGSMFGTAAAVLVVFLTQGFTMGMIAALVLVVLQQIDANILQPRLMGDSFALSPLLIIISITIGGAIAGIFGMLVAIPVVAVLKEMFDALITHQEKQKNG